MSSPPPEQRPWHAHVGVLVVAPLIVTVIGGLIVEYLKPGDGRSRAAPAEVSKPAAEVAKAARPAAGPDAWMSRKWIRVTKKGEDVLLPTENGKILNKMTEDGKTATIVYHPSGKQDGGLVPDNSSSLCEKVRFISMSDRELILVWHYKSRPGIFSNYPASEVMVHYQPVEAAATGTTRESWICLGVAVLLVVLGFLAPAIPHDKNSEGQAGGIGCLIIVLWSTAALLLCASVWGFFEAMRVSGL